MKKYRKNKRSSLKHLSKREEYLKRIYVSVQQRKYHRAAEL